MKNIKKQILYYENFKTKKIYTPTSFWSNLIKKNYKLLKKGKIRDFRNLEIGFIGFSPYFSEIKRFNINRKILNGITKTIRKSHIISKGKEKILHLINSSLIGHERAKLQYYLLLTDNIKPLFSNFCESKIGNPTEQFKFGKNLFSASSLNYLNGLLFLKKNIGTFDNKKVLEIGGGFGSVGEILNNLKIKNYKYINLDLPPLNIVSEYYLNKSCNQNIGNHFLFKNKKIINIDNLPKLNCLPNYDIEKLRGKIDIFINFISFQEMEYEVVKNYLNKIKKLKPKFILLRNLREGKNTIKNKNNYNHKFNYYVEKPIKKNDYINLLKTKYVLVDCNIEPYYHKTWDNYNSELLLFKKK